MRRLLVLVVSTAFCIGCRAETNNKEPRLPPRPRGEIRTPDTIHYLGASFSDDGKEVLLAGFVHWDVGGGWRPHSPRDDAYFVSLADTQSGKEVWKVVQRDLCRNPAFIPGQPWVIVRTEQGFEIWDRHTGEALKRSEPLFSKWPGEGYFEPFSDGTHMVGWGYEINAPRTAPWVLDLRIWELPGLREQGRFGAEVVHGHNLENAFAAPRGSLVLLTVIPYVNSERNDQHLMRVWDTATGNVLYEFAQRVSGRNTVGWNTKTAAWSADGKHLLLDYYEIKNHKLHRSCLVLWDAVAGKQVRFFADRPANRQTCLGSEASPLAFSADTKQAIAVDYDRFFRRWEVETGKELKAVPLTDTGVLALSRDGALALSAQRKIWDTNTGKILQTLEETAWEYPPLKVPDH